MSKKRTSSESNNDNQANEGSDSVLRHEDNAKRAKLAPLSDTTLQDLPIPLLKCILVRAVTNEVIGMKLAKSVWKDKADLVMRRLKTVCLSWNSILATNEFRKEVHDILDGTARELTRVDMLHQSLLPFVVFRVTAMKEEIFLLCGEDDQKKVNVYDRNNMAEVKEVIALPGIRPVDIEACNVSNCVYVLGLNMERKCPSILRMARDGEHHQFNILPWISGLKLPVYTLSVCAKGMLYVPQGENPAAVSIYNAIGSLASSVDIHGFRYVDRVIQRSNGNLVLASITDDHSERVLTEIDTDGKIQRQYRSSLGEGSRVDVANMRGRIMIRKLPRGMELLDPELNLLEAVDCGFIGIFAAFNLLHYDSERNEAITVIVYKRGDSLIIISRENE